MRGVTGGTAVVGRGDMSAEGLIGGGGGGGGCTRSSLAAACCSKSSKLRYDRFSINRNDCRLSKANSILDKICLR